MKKIFTLIAFALSAIVANADDIIRYEAAAELPAGVTVTGNTEIKKVKIHSNKDEVNCIQFSSGYTTDGAFNSNAIVLAPAGGLKTGDVIKFAGFFNNSDDTKKSAIDIFTLDGTKPTVLFTSAQFINGRTSADDPVVETYTLTADVATLYIGRNGNTGTNIYSLIVSREAGQGGGEDTPAGQAEKFVALTWDGTSYTAAPEFSSIVADPAKGGVANNANNGLSTVTFGTANMSVVGVSGSNPADVTETEPGVFPGWINGYQDVKWDFKNQGDINYAWIQGSGNPYVEINAEAVTKDDAPTGTWRPTYVYYGPKEEVVNDKSYKKSLPVNGTYYKFTPKADGKLTVNIWANKGNHNTFVMEESSLELIPYTVEGYINGQNEIIGVNEDGSNQYGGKKWLSNEEILALHDASGNASNPYIIGAGNQAFWGNIIFNVEKAKTYWLLQASSQVGFGGYEFTANGTDGIENVAVAPAAKITKTIENGKVVIKNGAKTFNVAGQLVK